MERTTERKLWITAIVLMLSLGGVAVGQGGIDCTDEIAATGACVSKIVLDLSLACPEAGYHKPLPVDVEAVCGEAGFTRAPAECPECKSSEPCDECQDCTLEFSGEAALIRTGRTTLATYTPNVGRLAESRIKPILGVSYTEGRDATVSVPGCNWRTYSCDPSPSVVGASSSGFWSGAIGAVIRW